jgi:anti-sigma factor RsiW
MTRSVIPIGRPAQHVTVQRLLPWYLNQTLSVAERDRVDKHLADCALCRSDLAAQREMVELIGPVAVGASADRAFAAMSSLLDQAPSDLARVGPARTAPVQRGWGRPWVPAALAAQFALILVLGVALFSRLEATAPYRTLGDTPPGRDAGEQVIIAFRDDVSLAEFRRILEPLNARVVDGPTATGAFVIAVPAGTAARAVARLRKAAEVRLVESLVLGRTP